MKKLRKDLEYSEHYGGIMFTRKHGTPGGEIVIKHTSRDGKTIIGQPRGGMRLFYSIEMFEDTNVKRKERLELKVAGIYTVLSIGFATLILWIISMLMV